MESVDVIIGCVSAASLTNPLGPCLRCVRSTIDIMNTFNDPIQIKYRLSLQTLNSQDYISKDFNIISCNIRGFKRRSCLIINHGQTLIVASCAFNISNKALSI